MGKENMLFMGSAALLQATEIKDVETNTLLNTVTITASIFDSITRYPVSILPFSSGGVAEIIEGDVIVGATDGATALVNKVTVQSGYWKAGNAVGLLEISNQDDVFIAENINILDGQANIATIPAGDSTGLAVVLLGGGQVKIPMNTMGLTTDDFIRIESSKKYDGQYDIDAVVIDPYDGYITITAVNIAETFKGTEVIYIGIPNGKDLPLAHAALPDGEYHGIQPSDLEGVHEGNIYHIFEKIVYGAQTVLHKYTWDAGYYSNLKTGT